MHSALAALKLLGRRKAGSYGKPRKKYLKRVSAKAIRQANKKVS